MNVPLPPATGDAGYAHAFDEVVAPVVRRFAPDLIIVGAGQDASATDPLGRMSVNVAGFRALTDRVVALADELCGGRLVAALEGGYSLMHLPLGNLAILEGLAGLPPASPTTRSAPTCRASCATSSARPSPPRSRPTSADAARRARVLDRRRRHPPVLPPLEGEHTADVVIVGGGYTGMWTAWHLLAADPDARVVLLEGGRCGHGPSGRNGGFVSRMDLGLTRCAPTTATRRRAAWVARGARDRRRDRRVVRGRGRRRALPPRRRAGRLDGAGAGRVEGGGDRRRARCSPRRPSRRARAATRPCSAAACSCPHAATVHPARLAFGLRERLLARGAQLFEGSRAPAIGPAPGGIAVRTDRGVCARGPPCSRSTRPGRARAAAQPADGLLQPHRLTEPVPDVLDELGWRGGESISDGRALLHYLRTTRDDRIVFGWAGGRMAAGARPGGRMEVDPGVIAQVRARPRALVPPARGPPRSRTPGAARSTSPPRTGPRSSACAGCRPGPRSATPATASARRTSSAGRSRRSRWTARDAVTRLPFVEPEPRVGAARAVPDRRRGGHPPRARAQGGGRGGGPVADPVTRGLAALPGLLGLHIVR